MIRYISSATPIPVVPVGVTDSKNPLFVMILCENQIVVLALSPPSNHHFESQVLSDPGLKERVRMESAFSKEVGSIHDVARKKTARSLQYCSSHRRAS